MNRILIYVSLVAYLLQSFQSYSQTTLETVTTAGPTTDQAISIIETGSNGGNVKFMWTGSGSGAYASIDATDNSGTRPLVLNPTGGKVAIGTTTPRTGLHLTGHQSQIAGGFGTLTSAALQIQNETITGAGTTAELQLGGRSGSSLVPIGALSAVLQNDDGSGETGYLVFSTHLSTTASSLKEAMRITNDGLVGIGAAPRTGLHLSGNQSQITGGFGTLTSAALQIQNEAVTGAGTTAELQLGGRSGSSLVPIAAVSAILQNDDGSGQTGYIVFSTHSSTTSSSLTEAMRIGYDGLMAIGTNTFTTSELVTVKGDIKLLGTTPSSFQSIRAYSDSGGLNLQANTGNDGSQIRLFGKDNTLHPSAIEFLSYGTTANAAAMEFRTYNTTTGNNDFLFSVTKDGKMIVGKGIDSPLSIPGSYSIYAEKGVLTSKVKVALTSDVTNWSDYVFAKNYDLMPLGKVEAFIKSKQHLPEIPSADEVRKEGLDLADMDSKLLKKIEELTLYLIAEQKEIATQQKEITGQRKEIEELKKILR